EFKAMRGHIEADASHSTVPTFFVRNEPTFRDVEALIDQVMLASDGTTVRTIDVPAGTRPGFLGGVAELVHSSVEVLRDPKSGKQARRISPVSYVYGVRLYDLSLRSHERMA